jgi:hypothetical protein
MNATTPAQQVETAAQAFQQLIQKQAAAAAAAQPAQPVQPAQPAPQTAQPTPQTAQPAQPAPQTAQQTTPTPQAEASEAGDEEVEEEEASLEDRVDEIIQKCEFDRMPPFPVTDELVGKLGVNPNIAELTQIPATVVQGKLNAVEGSISEVVEKQQQLEWALFEPAFLDALRLCYATGVCIPPSLIYWTLQCLRNNEEASPKAVQWMEVLTALWEAAEATPTEGETDV